MTVVLRYTALVMRVHTVRLLLKCLILVKHILTKMGIEHYPLPHPSPLNRKFNDKKFEISVISGLQSYLDMV